MDDLAGVGVVVRDDEPHPAPHFREPLLSRNPPRSQVPRRNGLPALQLALQATSTELRVPVPDEEDLRESAHQPDHLLTLELARIRALFHPRVDGRIERLFV